MTLSWQTTVKILFLIVLLGTVLRFWHLGENSFVADEFLDINSSYGYAQTGTWQAWDFNFGRPAETNLNAERDERAFVYKWQVARLFHFLPPTEAVARSVSALWGIVSIIVVFWSAWVFTRRQEIGLIAALLAALSISALVFSRHLRMYAMFFPVYLASATAVYLALETRYRGRLRVLQEWGEKAALHIPYAALGALLFALSLLTHQLSAVLVFTVFIYLLFRAYQIHQETGSWRQPYSMFVLIMGGIVGLTAVFLPDYFRSFASGLTFPENHYSYFAHILSDYYHPILAVLVLTLGVWWLGKEEKKEKEALYLYLSFLVPLILAVWFFRRNVGSQYIYFAQSFVMIGVATGIYALGREVLENAKWTVRWSWGKNKMMLAVLAAVLILLPNWGYFLAENNTYHETSSSTNPNYRKVFGYFKKEVEPGEVLVTRNYRNYYWSGLEVPVENFGGELSKERLTLERLEAILTAHPRGWFIASGNDMDFVTREAEEFIVRNMDRISNDQVRGDILVYRWEMPR